MPSLSRGETALAFDDISSGEPSLVLVHGAYSNRTVWEYQIDHFSRTHRIVAVDLLGHGESDKPQQEYTVEGYADDLAWLCRKLRPKEPVVIGHSMGGLVAVQLAAAYPDLVNAVITLDSPSLIPGWSRSLLGSLDELMSSEDEYQNVLADFLRSGYLPVDDPERRERLVSQVATVPRHVVSSLWKNLANWDPTPAVAACRVPFLYIDHGQPNCDLALLEGLCPQLVSGKTVGAGHLALQEVPDQVNAMIERFIRHAQALADYFSTGGGLLAYLAKRDG